MTALEPHTASLAAPSGLRHAPTRQLSWRVAVALHLAPGAALLLFFLITAPALHAAGLPPVWGLLVGALVVVVPLELAIVVSSQAGAGKGRHRFWSALGLQPVLRADVRPLLLSAAACLLAPGLVIWLEPLLRDALLGWSPRWFSAGLTGLSTFPPAVQVATLVLWLLSCVLIGPAVEEVYFRGWLLPQLPGGLGRACAVNAALFSVYHLWQPSAWLTVFAFAFPLALLGRARANATLPVAVHCTVNLVTFLGLLLGTVQR